MKPPLAFTLTTESIGSRKKTDESRKPAHGPTGSARGRHARPQLAVQARAAAGAETRTLQNYFRKTTQRPIATEIRRVRIERAKRELAQSDRTLDAIARD